MNKKTRPPIIIVEGPDGSGKTTLIRNLKTDWYCVHSGPDVNTFDQHVKLINEVQGSTIFDRFMLGEFVYGPVMRGKSQLTWAQARMIERLLLAHSAVLVMCLPPYEMCLGNWCKNHQDEYVQDEARFTQIYQRYCNLVELAKLNGARLPMIVYDYTKDFNLGQFSDTYYRKRIMNEGPGIGCFRPRNILLVGDECSHQRYGENPFIDSSGCSLWLAQQLEDAGIPEKELYWINSITGGKLTDLSFIKALNPRKIIALGLKASMFLNSSRIPHLTIFHPQFQKRFRHSEVYPLIELLRG